MTMDTAELETRITDAFREWADLLDETPPELSVEDTSAVNHRPTRRPRRAHAIAAIAAGIAAIVGLGVIATRWEGDDTPTRVVTDSGTTVHDAKFGYTVTIPPGWKREPVQTYPDDELPTILTLGYDYTPATISGDCASSIEQTGIHIILQEGNGPYEPRPARFGPHSGSGLAADPTSPLCTRLMQTMQFRDGKRTFFFAITMAPGMSPDRQAEAYAILNSLRFDPTSTVSTGGGNDTTVTTLGNDADIGLPNCVPEACTPGADGFSDLELQYAGINRVFTAGAGLEYHEVSVSESDGALKAEVLGQLVALPEVTRRVGAVRSGESAHPHRPDVTAPCMTRRAGPDLSEYLGLAPGFALQRAVHDSLMLRTVGTNGVCLAVTADRRPSRVSIDVVDGVVVGAQRY